MDINDINYGLIVIDPSEPDENGQFEILHFCGYAEAPSETDYDNLRQELTEDEEFGLTDRIGRCVIVYADPDTVAYFRHIAAQEDSDG